MKNKIIIFCIFSICGFLIFPVISHASSNPTLLRILNYYQDSNGRITFKWQEDYDGFALAHAAYGFDDSVGIQLGGADFPSNGGEGFYPDSPDNFDLGSDKAFTNFLTTCNELTATGRICISQPKALINRNDNSVIVSNSSGLLYTDVSSYVNAGGLLHTIKGGIFHVLSDGNYRISNTNQFNFGDAELAYIPPPVVVTKTPVLIVPGLIGTGLKNSSDLLWADLGRMFTDISDSFIDPLGFNKDVTSSDSGVSILNIIGSEKFSGITLFDYTDGLITEFKNQGYVEGVGSTATLFTFPYDWRYGASGKYPNNSTNSNLLAQKIQDIMTQTGSNKVDIVAHSEGGLIVKKYVMDHVADNHIGKAIFVGVPNTGAPKAVKVLLQGDNFGIPWLAQDEIKKITANMPVAYDLSPSQQYYNTKGSFVEVIDEGTIGDTTTPHTDKNLTYNEFKSYLTLDHALNSIALTGAENLHTQNFDNFDLRTAGVDLYSIDGCKAATVGKIIEDRYKNVLGNSFVDYKKPTFAPGDGTVPLESATNLPINDSNKFYLLAGDHSSMLSHDGSRQEIVDIISGSALNPKPSLISQDITKCNLHGKAISVFSPVNIFATDQFGNQLGIASDGSIVNQIPNADFEILNGHKFMYLPTDDGQTYNVQMNGTDTGTFTLDSQDIDNSQVTSTEVFSDIPVTKDLTGQINLSNSTNTPTTLVVQQTPTDPPSTILPTAVVDSNQSQDILAPISTATIAGTQGQHNFYKSNVTVTITALDQVVVGQENQTSGVLSISYNIDNVGMQKATGSTLTLPVSSEGVHVVTFFSTDDAGNHEQQKTITFTIDKTAPEALVQFDSVAKNLKFIGQDAISASTLLLISSQNNTITIADQAGNNIAISLAYNTSRTSTSAVLKSIQYNGVLAPLGKNQLTFSWAYGKNNVLNTLSQSVANNNGYNILASYSAGKTKITGKDSTGKFSKTINGLVIVKVKIQNGNLQWSY